MAFVQFTSVSLAFGARDILQDAALYMADGTKAALAGPNGVGKTTLLKIIAGELPPDSGDRAIQKGTRVSYLPQTKALDSSDSVYYEAEKAFVAIENLLNERDEIGKKLEETGENADVSKLLENYHHLDESINNSGYWSRKEKIREVLTGLGFYEEDFERKVNELSGGWQMRVALAKVILENPDIMLLDEPTNYLDIEARTWLEIYLVNYKGGFIIVSHDRSFLDATIKEVYELWNGKLSRYPGIYTSYEKRRASEMETLLKEYDAQQEEIAHLEDFIRRFRYKPTKAAQVQSRIKMLEKIVPIVIPENMKKVHFKFPDPPHCGKIALYIEDVEKSFGEKKVVDKISFTLDSGTKVAFVGHNGAGKSTLMRLIAGIDNDFEGNIRLGTGITIAYFSQETTSALNNNLTVEEEASSSCPTNLLPSIRNLLGAFLFRGDDVEKKVSVLSGGERARLALLKMLLHPANMLILDEPTNHLDLDSKDVLLDALKKFPGTVLFVSHDKFFIDSLAEKVLELNCGYSPKLYYGNYQYYLDKKAMANGDTETEARATSTVSNLQNITEQKTNRATPVDSKMARELEKKRATELNRLKKQEEALIEKLSELELQKKEIETKMSSPEYYSDGGKMKLLGQELLTLEPEISRLTNEWEKLTETIENF